MCFHHHSPKSMYELYFYIDKNLLFRSTCYNAIRKYLNIEDELNKLHFESFLHPILQSGRRHFFLSMLLSKLTLRLNKIRTLMESLSYCSFVSSKVFLGTNIKYNGSYRISIKSFCKSKLCNAIEKSDCIDIYHMPGHYFTHLYLTFQTITAKLIADRQNIHLQNTCFWHIVVKVPNIIGHVAISKIGLKPHATFVL